MKRIVESASAYHVGGTKYLETIKIIEKEDCLLQRIFSLDETSLKFKNERENVMSPYRIVYKDMQKKAMQLKIIPIFKKHLAFLCAVHSMLHDHCDNFQPGTLASLQ
jgi:hypothetical protein